MESVAFTFLMFLFGLFGVRSSPEVLNSDWKIVKLWEPDTFEHRILLLESTTVPQRCRENKNQYVVFPQVYMGRQEILVDGYTVYTNTLADHWSLSGTLFDRAVINCFVFSNGAKVTFESTSYMAFYASFNAFPYFSRYYPLWQFLYSSVYLIAASLCLFLGIIGAIVMWSQETRKDIFYFIFQQISFFLFIGAYGGSIGFEFNSHLQHSTVLFGFAVGFFLFVSKELKILNIGVVKISTLCGIIAAVIMSFGHENMTQSLIVLFIPPYIGLMAAIVYGKLRRHRLKEAAVFLAVLLIGVKDSYLTIISREGLTHLSILIVLVSVITFLKIFSSVNKRKADAELLSAKLASEKAIFSRVSSTYESYREIVHDLKSPITAINFALHGQDVSIQNLKSIARRTSDILDRIEERGYKRVLDWYSVPFCEQSIVGIFEEKENISLDIKNGVQASKLECLFDPVDFEIVFAELIDNSIKAGATGCQIDLQLDNRNIFNIAYFDNGPGMNEAIIEKIGEKGISRTSSGIGLLGIKTKVESWGGEFIIAKSRAGFRCEIRIRTRLV